MHSSVLADVSEPAVCQLRAINAPAQLTQRCPIGPPWRLQWLCPLSATVLGNGELLTLFQFLENLRVGRQVFTGLINRREAYHQDKYHVDASNSQPTLSDHIGIQACERVIGGIGISRVDETEMEEVALALIDIGDEFAALHHSQSWFPWCGDRRLTSVS